MSKDIDVYEYKGKLKEYEEDKFVDICDEKGVGLVTVGKTNPKADARLKGFGYAEGDRVLVIIQ